MVVKLSMQDIFGEQFQHMASNEVGELMLLKQYVYLSSMSSADAVSYHKKVSDGFNKVDVQRFPHFDIDALKMRLLDRDVDSWKFMPGSNNLMLSYIQAGRYQDIITIANYQQLCDLIVNYYDSIRIYAERIASSYEYLSGRYELIGLFRTCEIYLREDKELIGDEPDQILQENFSLNMEKCFSQIIDRLSKKELELFQLAHGNIRVASKQQTAYHYALLLIEEHYGIPFSYITQERHGRMMKNIRALNQNAVSLTKEFPDYSSLWSELFPKFALYKKPSVKSLQDGKRFVENMPYMLENPLYLISLLYEGMN